MRLFIAIDFSDELKNSLAGVMTALKKCDVSASFSARENLHLTLVFIGETDREDDAVAAMKKTGGSPFSLKFSGLGSFPSREGEVLWTGVQAEDGLFTLVENLKKALTARGFQIEKRKFAPHLTLARRTIFPDRRKAEDFADVVGEYEMKCREIHLMRSDRINGRLRYSKVFTLPLGKFGR